MKLIKETDFVYIKELLNKGLSPKQIKDLTKRSGSTIYLIGKTDNLEEYKDLSRGLKASKTNSISLAQTVSDNGLTSTDPTVESLELLESYIDELKLLISKTIETIVNQKVSKEVGKIQVELTELRRLKDEAKTSNWATSLARKFGA